MSFPIDLDHHRLGPAHSACKNLKTALEEATQISTQAQGHLLVAQLDALQGWDAVQDLDHALGAVSRLYQQLSFAAALARRAVRRQQAVA